MYFYLKQHLGGANVQLDASRLDLITSIVEDEVNQSRIPGAVVAVGIGEVTHYLQAFGYSENYQGTTRTMTVDTIFDLASLTKVTATLPVVLSLVDDGALRLSDPVALFLPEFQTGEKSSVNVRHLLTHTSGLISHRDYHALYHTRADILSAIRNEALTRAPGEKVEYSDLGFILLGEIIREVTHQSLDVAAERNVFAKLGMVDTLFCPPASLKSRVAATENGKLGVVHDENAEALGGVSGHAGLFSTIADLRTYVQMWLGLREPVLSQAVRAIAVQNQTPHLAGNRGIGFVCRFDSYDHTGDLWPHTTVGHTGFTGTSLAFDPVSSLWMIILTNDVHYGRQRKSVIRLRGRLHNVVGSAIRA